MRLRTLGLRALVVIGAACALVVGPGQARGADGPAVDVGQIKVARGDVRVRRDGQQVPGHVGTHVRQSDVIVTGPDGAVGIVFLDNSRLSIGPDSTLALDRFTFNSTTHDGAFESSLRRGTLAAVSGQIARRSPDAMKVKTPAAVLGVRGTEFVVRTSEAAE
jgi:hypothetical protein